MSQKKKLNQSGTNTQSNFCRQVYESLLNVMRLVDGYVFLYFLFCSTTRKVIASFWVSSVRKDLFKGAMLVNLCRSHYLVPFTQT